MIPIPILSDHNDIVCTKQYLSKFQITNSLSNQTSWDTNHTTPFQFQNSLQETTYSRGDASPKAYSSDVTEHSDYFVWKDTSERVARRCDDTVDKKRVNSCILKHLFLEGFEQPKISPKNPGNALSDALRMSRFQKIAAEKKPRSAWCCGTVLRAVLIDK